jgi:hypothetical protein
MATHTIETLGNVRRIRVSELELTRRICSRPRFAQLLNGSNKFVVPRTVKGEPTPFVKVIARSVAQKRRSHERSSDQGSAARSENCVEA